MDITLVLFKQIILMFIYMMIGFTLFKKKIVTIQGSKDLASILIFVILPAAIIKSYLVNFSWDMFNKMIMSFIVSAIAIIISIIVARILFGKGYPMEHFCVSFSNAGFIGIPLVSKVLGEDAIFYIAMLITLTIILQWTYGVMVITGDKSVISLKKIVTNPVVISVAVAILLFLLPVKLPGIIVSAVGGLASLNGPLAMIVLGIYLAQTNIRELFTTKIVYAASAVRVIVIPLITIAIFSLLPSEFKEIRLAVLISASTSIGTNAAVFAQMNNLDYTRAVKEICLSTIFSIVTMPLVLGFANMIW